MSINLRFKIMQFLQFFLWGSWLITFGSYAFHKLHFSGSEIGAVYSTLGIASIITPSIVGAIADKWINKERLYAILHLCGSILLFKVSFITNKDQMFWFMLINMMCYMPTIPLGYSICYDVLTRNNINCTTEFPKIRVWGTVGFIVAMWTISLSHLELSPLQLHIGAAAQLILAIYSFTLPKCPPVKSNQKKTLSEALGLDALSLFKDKNILIFMIFAMILGMASQTSNIWTDVFLHSFDHIAKYKDTFVTQYPAIIASIATISETAFIVAIPFFLKKYGIKTVMLISMFAWVVRFGFLAIGTPESIGMIFIILSMIAYGCAFDFFNISGSIYINNVATEKTRASAQGIFLTLVNGFGFFFGSHLSGYLVDYYTSENNATNWSSIWLVCSITFIVVAILFKIMFKHKHT
ncbi:MAG: nucleoside permease [Burkholderiales bacterium]|nr:nucleoside permease [Burkholderiales bacterium]